jgi:hypothetical protein
VNRKRTVTSNKIFETLQDGEGHVTRSAVPANTLHFTSLGNCTLCVMVATYQHDVHRLLLWLLTKSVTV